MSALQEDLRISRAGLVLRALSNPWIQAVAVAVAYALSAQASMTLVLGARTQPVFFPASGVALACLLLSPAGRPQRITLAAIGIGSLLWSLLQGLSLLASVGCAAAAMAGAALGAVATRTASPQDPHASTFRGMAGLLGPGTIATAAAAASIAALTVALLPRPLDAPVHLLHVWTGRFLADTAGVQLVAPILLWLASTSRNARSGWLRFEAAVVLTGAALGSLAIFGATPISSGVALALLCLPIPVLVLVATRLGPAGTSAAAFIVGAFAVWCTNADRGPIAALNASPRDEVLGIQSYMAIITGSSLLLAAAVADWRRTERLLRRSEGRYREFVSHSSEGVWCIDMHPGVDVTTPTAEQIELFYANARMSECNDAMARMYGLNSASELADVPLHQLMVREDPRNDAYLRAFIESGYRLDNAESHERDLEGRDKYFLNSLVGVVESGRIVRAWGSQRDITAVRQAEQELSRTRARLAAAMDAADMAAWTLDFQTGTLSFDDTVRRLYSLPKDSGSPLPAAFFLERIHPQDSPAVRERLEQVRRGEAPYRAEYRVPQPDGTVRWISSRGSVQTDAAGVPLLLTGFCADITEIKQGASEREQLQAQLRQAQKLESLGLMAGGIAHDFNNLLVGILGSAGLAQSQVKPGDPVYATLSNIEQSARRAADLTRQLLAYAGKSRFVKEAVDLRRLVADVLPMLQAHTAPHISFAADLSPRAPVVMADPTQMQQVLINLATNAGEALGERGGQVHIRIGTVHATRQMLDAEYLHADLIAPGQFAFLEVEDTGRGMDEQTVARIFDPFYTTKFTGRGLGLAVVLGIVRGHQGAIRVVSGPGRGSTFRVLLPALPAGTLAAPAAEPKPLPPTSKGGRVLIVDDEAMVRDVTAKLLQRAGWVATTVAGGPEALGLLQSAEARFDAVILDVTMPGMSGMEVLREIRRVRPGLPVLLSSGYTPEAIDGAAELKPDGFLQKPFTPEALRRAVNGLISPPSSHG